MAHAVDFKIAVPLGLERVQLKTNPAVIEGPGSQNKILWTTERDFSTNKLKATKTKPNEINKGLTTLINVPG